MGPQGQEAINIDALSGSVVAWIRDSLLSAEILGQLALIGAALVAAWLLAASIAPGRCASCPKTE